MTLNRTMPTLTMLAVMALLTTACGSETQNDVDRISAAIVEATDGFETSVAAYTPSPIDWEYCVPNPVVAELDVGAFDTLTAAGSKVTLNGADREGSVEVLLYDDPATTVEVVGLYNWYLGSRRECLASTNTVERILNGAVDDRQYTQVDIPGADGAFSGILSNLSGQVAYVDVAIASTGTGVIVVSFTSDAGPTDPVLLESIIAAGLGAG